YFFLYHLLSLYLFDFTLFYLLSLFFFFFFNDTSTTEIYTLSLHDALPIFETKIHETFRLQYLKDVVFARVFDDPTSSILSSLILDRKSTRLNSSHLVISYAVFCLKKKKKKKNNIKLNYIQIQTILI